MPRLAGPEERENRRETVTRISTGLGSWLEGHRAEIRLALRTTVAGLITFALAHWLELAQSYWAVLTAVIVIQGNVGGSIKAAADRLIGTLGGGACGVLVALILPQTDLLSRAVGLGMALAPLAFAAALLPSLRIAPLTAVIVLLGSSSQASGPLPSALARLVEIGLGSAIACAVSLLVLPTRAHRQVSEGAGRVLALLAELTPALLAGLSNSRDAVKLHLLNRQIRTALAKLEAAADEARRERASHLTDEPDPEPVVRTLRRLRYDLVMVDRATRDPLPTAVAGQLSPALAELSAALAAFLRESASAITARRPPPALEPFRQALAKYGAAMAEVRRQGLTRDLPGEAVARIFGLAFAFEQIARELADLADRARELADVST